MDKLETRTWAEIDLARLEHNYNALRGMIPPTCKFLGVVKANAYGHGALPVAKKLAALGADYLAVACLAEAQALRQGGITAPVLILGHTDPLYTQDLLDLNCTQMVGDRTSAEGYAEAATAAGKTLKVHVKVDTGMSRLGFLCHEEQLDASAAEIAGLCALSGLDAEGIFTHFSDADGSEEYTMGQFTRFMNLLAGLKAEGVTFQIRHCAASAAVINYPCTHLDMVRPGIALYGHYPAPDMETLCTLLPVMALKTRIATVRSLPAGTPVSYGRTHVLERESRLAVLPVGYGDGFSRRCSNGLNVLINGEIAPIVGRICMDLCMADVTDSSADTGDVVTLYGDEVPVEQAAERVGTIQYELLCAVAPRVPRIYKD